MTSPPVTIQAAEGDVDLTESSQSFHGNRCLVDVGDCDRWISRRAEIDGRCATGWHVGDRDEDRPLRSSHHDIADEELAQLQRCVSEAAASGDTQQQHGYCEAGEGEPGCRALPSLVVADHGI